MKQSPRNIFEIFSCSWALENFQPVPGSQIVGEGLRRSWSPQFPPVLFSCLPFLNSAGPTISQPGIGKKILGILEGSERIFPRKRSLGATGKNISDILAYSSRVPLLSVFLPHFDVIWDLLLKRPTAIWNLFFNRCRNIEVYSGQQLPFAKRK